LPAPARRIDIRGADAAVGAGLLEVYRAIAQYLLALKDAQVVDGKVIADNINPDAPAVTVVNGLVQPERFSSRKSCRKHCGIFNARTKNKVQSLRTQVLTLLLDANAQRRTWRTTLEHSAGGSCFCRAAPTAQRHDPQCVALLAQEAGAEARPVGFECFHGCRCVTGVERMRGACDQRELIFEQGFFSCRARRRSFTIARLPNVEFCRQRRRFALRSCRRRSVSLFTNVCRSAGRSRRRMN
jgi:hypothetical protein